MVDYCHINLSIGFGWLWDCVQKFPTILCRKLPLSGSLLASIKGDFFTYMPSVNPLLRCDYRHLQADHPAFLLIDLPCSHKGNHLVISSMKGGGMVKDSQGVQIIFVNDSTLWFGQKFKKCQTFHMFKKF